LVGYIDSMLGHADTACAREVKGLSHTNLVYISQCEMAAATRKG
jgi:hypothetical protein